MTTKSIILQKNQRKDSEADMDLFTQIISSLKDIKAGRVRRVR